MKIRTTLWLSICALLALSLAALPAAADDDDDDNRASKRIAIATQGRLVAPGDVEGTWQAVGAFVDSGSYTEHFELSNQNTFLVARKTLTSALDGSTIVLDVRTNVVWLSPSTATFSGGRWRVVGGTGRYSDLDGGGKPAAVFAFADLAAGTVLVVHTGKADLDD